MIIVTANGSEAQMRHALLKNHRRAGAQVQRRMLTEAQSTWQRMAAEEMLSGAARLHLPVLRSKGQLSPEHPRL